MAFVDHNQVKEIRGHLFKGFLIFFRAGDGLVQREVDFKGRVDGAPGDLGHRRAKRQEVVIFGLIDQNVAIGQEQDPLLTFRFP